MTTTKVDSEETYWTVKNEKSGGKPMPMTSRWLTMDATMLSALLRWLA